MSRSSRRRFLQSAGLAAAPAGAVAAAPQPQRKAYRRSQFAPSGRPQKLTENLFVFEDTCQVYIIRDGSRCALIDFGSGKVLDHLRDLGIQKVDWILHTHHHRDQCQGDWRAVERGIPIAVPAHERHLFADAENFWRNRRVFHLYYVRNDFNTITENIPVAARSTTIRHSAGTAPTSSSCPRQGIRWERSRCWHPSTAAQRGFHGRPDVLARQDPESL